MMRLDKMLAHCGYGSRKEVKELIRKGYVLVNGEAITNDDYKVDEINDEVVIANQSVSYEHNIYLMLNKPEGYVSATYDNFDPTVLDLIDGYEKRNLFPVGRLDIDTVGLLLITNDGMLAHKLLAPKSHVDKVYYLRYIMFFRHYQDWFVETKPAGAILQYIGTRTLDIYLIHFIVMPKLTFVGTWLNAHQPNFLVDILCSFCVAAPVIALCCLISHILRVSPIFSKYLFGR